MEQVKIEINSMAVPVPGDKVFIVRRTVKLNSRKKLYESRKSTDVELVLGEVSEITCSLISVRTGTDYEDHISWYGSAFVQTDTFLGNTRITPWNVACCQEDGEQLLVFFKEKGLTMWPDGRVVFENGEFMDFPWVAAKTANNAADK